MHVVSVDVGQRARWPGAARSCRTGIFKQPTAERSHPPPQSRRRRPSRPHRPRRTRQSRLRLSRRALRLLREQLPDRDFPFGIFGENLTLSGLPEDTAHVGDELLVGTARLVISQPRLPCYKLGIRFDDPDMIARSAQQPSRLLSRRVGRRRSQRRRHDAAITEDENRLTVTELFRLLIHDKTNTEMMRRACACGIWRRCFRTKLESKGGSLGMRKHSEKRHGHRAVKNGARSEQR